MSDDQDYCDAVADAGRALRAFGKMCAEAAADLGAPRGLDFYTQDFDDDAEELAQLETHVRDLDVQVNGESGDERLADVINLADRRANRSV